jgi:hypothetical protein
LHTESQGLSSRPNFPPPLSPLIPPLLPFSPSLLPSFSSHDCLFTLPF